MQRVDQTNRDDEENDAYSQLVDVLDTIPIQCKEVTDLPEEKRQEICRLIEMQKQARQIERK